jgi:aldehyde dehydrogenase (NAD+)
MNFDDNYGMLIAGTLEFGSAVLEVRNAVTEEVIARVPDAASEDLDREIVAARRAFPAKTYALAQRVASGTVWINEVQILLPPAAFGGMKHSGVGVGGEVEGLLEYTNTQTIMRRKNPASAPEHSR